MLPAINFRRGSHYHFKVRFPWPCLTGSLVLRRSLSTAHIIRRALAKLKLLATAQTPPLACLDPPTLQSEAGASPQAPTRYQTRLRWDSAVHPPQRLDLLTRDPATGSGPPVPDGNAKPAASASAKDLEQNTQEANDAPRELGGGEKPDSLGLCRDQQQS